MNDKEKFEKEALAEFLEMTGIPKERINCYSRISRVEFHAYGETYEFKNPGLAVMLDAGSPGDRSQVVYFPNKPRKGHWKLVQRGRSIDVCCSNCEAVRIERYAYNYTIGQLNKEDLKERFECADMRYCPNCGFYMSESEEE